MILIDKLSEAVYQSMHQIGKKTSEILEVNKLNLSVNKRKREIEELYEELGAYVYQYLRQYERLTREDVDQYVNKIAYLQKDIESLEKLILSVQNIQHCANCKVEFDEEISYCPLCGRYIKK
ncbi:hypothetical protein [Clostridium formicaceticum]|uniref:Zinc ribbon domain-containing protein n=1 Tax=Clostridium formicaceticum TaxID=1497 RepID=A0AAC9WFB7_9CLOT|nr:hypothetical protein [Clostridium formicaceticum]AOY76190.1 hypothetical protein BJL90_09910 [Clostridium formicaceticum]ARE86563.1 hypothetical protein CLFO_08870 [Clostridium formicaceticum]